MKLKHLKKGRIFNTYLFYQHNEPLLTRVRVIDVVGDDIIVDVVTSDVVFESRLLKNELAKPYLSIMDDVLIIKKKHAQKLLPSSFSLHSTYWCNKTVYDKLFDVRQFNQCVPISGTQVFLDDRSPNKKCFIGQRRSENEKTFEYFHELQDILEDNGLDSFIPLTASEVSGIYPAMINLSLGVCRHWMMQMENYITENPITGMFGCDRKILFMMLFRHYNPQVRREEPYYWDNNEGFKKAFDFIVKITDKRIQENGEV